MLHPNLNANLWIHFVRIESQFEERTYPAGLRMACMSKVAEWDERSDFMVVAGYIFGGNVQSEKKNIARDYEQLFQSID